MVIPMAIPDLRFNITARKTSFSLRLSAVLWLLMVVAQLPAGSDIAEGKSLLPVTQASVQQSASGPEAAATVTVNKKFNNREVKVRAGGMIRVELEELGAAGYVWTIQNLDKAHFEVVKVQTDEDRPKDDVTGAPVTKTWLIRTKTGGQSALKFIHCRPWEDAKNASDTFVLKVRIVP
jgi:predicted secreted protein